MNLQLLDLFNFKLELSIFVLDSSIIDTNILLIGKCITKLFLSNFVIFLQIGQVISLLIFIICKQVVQNGCPHFRFRGCLYFSKHIGQLIISISLFLLYIIESKVFLLYLFFVLNPHYFF